MEAASLVQWQGALRQLSEEKKQSCVHLTNCDSKTTIVNDQQTEPIITICRPIKPLLTYYVGMFIRWLVYTYYCVVSSLLASSQGDGGGHKDWILCFA